MPRQEESDSHDSDYSTDTDDEHVPSAALKTLGTNSKISPHALEEVYKKQRGMCRITGMPLTMTDAAIVQLPMNYLFGSL